MKVSFKGYRNVGSISLTIRDDFNMPTSSQIWYHVELTNKNGKDLDENKALLKKYPNSINPLALNIRSNVNVTRTGLVHDIFINKQKVDLNSKENIEDIKKIRNLMNKIESTPYEKMEKDKHYFDSYEIVDAFNETFEDCVKKDDLQKEYFDKPLFNHYMNAAHSKIFVKNNAKIISQNITYNFKDYGIE